MQLNEFHHATLTEQCCYFHEQLECTDTLPELSQLLLELVSSVTTAVGARLGYYFLQLEVLPEDNRLASK